ncbi:ArsR/SmtB family transcription factor [Futiania mangrovi]|uniref:Metalloregulator ArsR/SmtB family transcription factor n=1 Tax=Futiania mangrovi TaxID=2959716 RepID=A0A9J6PFW6_9PROT|nr:metalloregulator ArsR/SmtB family transcription factor [Futiania mangrovii]MCP1337366.1 metalloregulator ArsR/SmtB family transcription factor [Futiania mangrovii]
MDVAEVILPSPNPEVMATHAREARDFLKALAHESRLMILCMLCRREMTVAELCAALDQRQPAVSQQLARLREENLVTIRREGKHIHYSIASEDARTVVSLLYDIFCKPAEKDGC